ncbi:MAG: DedA family protein, partial [Patescibacteria group bacterium]|nr:DedA family protein [Patescibacteria group bacterium]
GELVIQFLTNYGYIIMIPLMMVIGPIVSIVAAFMASMGIFNVYIVFVISFVAGMIGDILLYGAGRKWGMRAVHRINGRFGVTENSVLKMEKAFEAHGGKLIIAVKSTTGLCWVTFIAAGIVKMPFWRFVMYTIIGGFVWSGFLVIVGYFFGYMYKQIVQYISFAGWILAALLIAALVAWYKHDKRKSQKILQNMGTVTVAKNEKTW